MKKFILVVMFVLFLTACKEEVIDCNQGEEGTNLNQLCTDFKSISLLGDDIYYVINFHGETPNYEEILYQNKLFYQSLEPYFEANVITFDDSNLTKEDGETGSVKVIYNDGLNQELSKQFFVEVVDVTNILNEDNIGSIPVTDKISLTCDGGTIEFDTVNDNYFSIDVYNDQGKHELSTIEYILYFGGGLVYNDCYLDVKVSILGYKVELIENYDLENETRTTYNVFHVDYDVHRDNPFIAEEGSLFIVQVRDNLYYEIKRIEFVDLESIEIDFDVYLNDTLLQSETVLLDNDYPSDDYNLIENTTAHFEKISNEKLWITVYDFLNEMYFYYILDPNQ